MLCERTLAPCKWGVVQGRAVIQYICSFLYLLPTFTVLKTFLLSISSTLANLFSPCNFPLVPFPPLETASSVCTRHITRRKFCERTKTETALFKTEQGSTASRLFRGVIDETNYSAGYISSFSCAIPLIIVKHKNLFLLSSASKLYWLHLDSWQAISPGIWATFSCAPELYVPWETKSKRKHLCTGYAFLYEPVYSSQRAGRTHKELPVLIGIGRGYSTYSFM